MKNILRRFLSVLLVLAMLTSGFFIFDPSVLLPTAQASVSTESSANAGSVWFVVPEAVYLKPVWNSYYASGSYDFQWFVNNALYADGSVHCETGEDAVGDIYFRYATASSVSIQFEWMDATGLIIDGGCIAYGDGKDRGSGSVYTTAVSESPISVTSGVSPTMAPTLTGCYIRWTATFTDNADGRVKTAYAYTYVYKPYVQPVGVALRTLNDRGTDSHGENLSWISGAHDTDSAYAGSYYPNTSLSSDGKGLLAFSSGANNGMLAGNLYAQLASSNASLSRFYYTDMSNTGASGWLNQTTSPLYVPDKSFNYTSNSSSSGASGDYAFYTFGYSPRALLTVDNSRYTNLNQIPNLSIGMMVTNDESSYSSGAWFVSNYTGTPATAKIADLEKNSTSTSEALWNRYKGTDVLGSVGSYTSSTWVDGAEAEGIKYNDRWSKPISASSASGMFYVGTGYFNHDDKDSDHCGGDTIWNVSELRTYITFCNKDALRTAMQSAVSYAAVLDKAFYDTTCASWINYQNLFQAAGFALTKLDGSFSATAQVDGTNVTYGTPEALAQALTSAVNVLLAGSGRVSGTVTQTNIALHQQSANVYTITKFNSNTDNYSSYDRVTISGDGYIGYHFAGLLKTERTPTLSVGSTFPFPSSFTTSATGATISGETVIYPHASTAGTDNNGNIYYSYYYLPNQFTVTFDGNDGTGSMSDQLFDYDAPQNLNANAFTRLGYTFKGWATTSNGAVLYSDQQNVSNLSTTDGDTITLFAIWDTNEYTINYVLNGGTITSDMYTQTYTINVGVALPTAERTGYVFEGWKADGAGNWSTLTYTPASLNPGKHGNVTLSARWNAISYTVVFNANGGSGTMSNQSFTFEESKALNANTFTRPGYSFLGWSMRSDATTALYKDKATVTALTTIANQTVDLFAVWSPVTYAITYNTADGTINNTDYPLSYTTETTFTLPDNVTKTGYEFSGWSVNTTVGNWTAGTVQTGTINSGMYGNLSLTAIWTPAAYTIQYEANGGSITGTSYTSTYTIETQIVLPRATKSGYAFSGWKANDAGNWGTSVYAAGRCAAGKYGNVTLTAEWSGVSYYVAFNGNNATGGSMSTQAFSFGVSANLKTNTYTRNGYTFLGWSTSATATEATYADGESVSDLSTVSNSTVTLYAVWSKITYTISYIQNGGTLQSGSFIKSYTVEDTLNLPQMEKAGYDFLGWKANGLGNWSNETYLGTVAAGMYGNVTLTADWTESQYTVTLDPAGGTISGTYSTTYDINTDIRLPDVTLDGYTFNGWKASWNGVLYKEVAPAGLYGNVTLTAQWTQRYYYVAFNGNGAASGFMSRQTFAFSEEKALTANAFSRPGYSFSGWSLTDNGTAIYADGAVVRNLTDVDYKTVTLYAVWKARSFAIAYNLNGASGSMFTTTVTMGKSVTLRACTITEATINNAPCTFGGWAISAQAAADGEVLYANKATFELDEDVLDALEVNWSAVKPTITLYAVWICEAVELLAQDGSTTVLNRDDHFIYGLATGITESDLNDLFLTVEGNGHLEYVYDGFIGTGSIVKLINDNTGVVEETFEIVIFGDVNGDGIVSPADASLSKSVLSSATEFQSGSAQMYAADLNGDGTIDSTDIVMLKALASSTLNIDQSTRELV